MVPFEVAKEYADEIGAVSAFEVSAKENTGINELFNDIAKHLYKNQQRRVHNSNFSLGSNAANEFTGVKGLETQ